MDQGKNMPGNSAVTVKLDNYKKILFFGLMALSLWPRIDTAVALTSGILFSLTLGNPVASMSVSLSKKLLQISVVGLGFGIGIDQVFQVGKASLVYTIIGIAFALLAGKLLGRFLTVGHNTSLLISFGTAICGGSAIAALAPVIKAKSEEVAVSLAIIFTLNSVALLLFPPLGHFFNLSQHSFGLWAALAIHDTSSVVGATSAFGPVALATGTTVKLTRALWIIPCTLTVALFNKSEQKTNFPLFILGFIAAAMIRSLLPQQTLLWDGISYAGRRLLVVTLFLIGAGLSRDVLRKVGFRPMLQGITLWLLISMITLAAIYQNVIH